MTPQRHVTWPACSSAAGPLPPPDVFALCPHDGSARCEIDYNNVADYMFRLTSRADSARNLTARPHRFQPGTDCGAVCPGFRRKIRAPRKKSGHFWLWRIFLDGDGGVAEVVLFGVLCVVC